MFLITGLGALPEPRRDRRVRDGARAATASTRCGRRTRSATSRMRQQVGPYRVEVIEPLRKLRLVCDGRRPRDRRSTSPGTVRSRPFEEARHTWRRNGRINLDAQRFAQVGTWDGELEVDGDEVRGHPGPLARDPRPVVGHPRRRGARAAGPRRRRADRGILVDLRADALRGLRGGRHPAGGARRHRVMNDVVRVWPEASGRRPEQLGWPEIDIHYALGHAHPDEARRSSSGPRTRKTLTMEVESLGYVALNVGAGLRGRPGLEPRSVAGPALRRGGGLRPHRSRPSPGGRRSA